MDVVGDQRPGKTAGFSVLQNLAEPLNKVDPICIVFEYLTPLDSPYYHMVKGTGCVYAGLSGHAPLIAYTFYYVNLLSYGYPLFSQQSGYGKSRPGFPVESETFCCAPYTLKYP